MKILKYIFLFTAVGALQSCWDDVEDIKGSGSSEEVALTINVNDEATGNAVSGAEVELYATLADYIADENVVATATTGSDGKATFGKGALGSGASSFFFTVKDGARRNWNFTSSVPTMIMNNGETVISTQVGDLPPGFIFLVSNTFSLDEYLYGAANALPDCEIGDRIVFLKNGDVRRIDGDDACATPSEFQLPLYDVSGEAWSSWSLSTDGSILSIRDLDPEFEGSADAGIVIDEAAGTVVIDYYAGFYIANLSAL